MNRLQIQSNSSLRMIVLDDDPTFTKVMERHAKRMDIEIVCENVVSRFVDRLAAEKFDIVVMDYYLDAYLGTEIARAIPHLPVILVSSKSDVLRSDQGIGVGVNKFVHKKFGAKRILEEALALGESFRLVDQRRSA